MKTYIVKDGDLYKIGKTSNIKNRMSSLSCGNANALLIRVYNGDYEKTLHFMYQFLRHRGEWFRLSEADISNIDFFINQELPAIDFDLNADARILNRYDTFSRQLSMTLFFANKIGYSCNEDEIKDCGEIVHMNQDDKCVFRIKSNGHEFKKWKLMVLYNPNISVALFRNASDDDKKRLYKDGVSIRSFGF